MQVVRVTVLVLLLVPFMCDHLRGAGGPAPPSATFHVQGKIRNPWDFLPFSAAPHVEVSFQGHDVFKTVSVNEKGFYEADLPVGFYTMTVTGQKLEPQQTSFLTKYVRRFRVASHKTIILNGTLYKARLTCDVGIPSGLTAAQQKEEWKNICGGEDSFPFPSKDGAPFELYIQYPLREHANRSYIYSIDRSAQPDVPVSVAYNLFSLAANKVVYDANNATIEASGNVVVSNASGVTRRTQSITFKIEDGRAIPTD